MIYRMKVTCFTPKGKARKCSKSFGMKYFSATNKPIATKIVSDHEFNYIYDYKSAKDRYKIISKKIPMAESRIRAFYTIIMSLVGRGNKLSKKLAWTTEKTRRWIMKQLHKRVKDPKEMEDFVDAVDLSDKKAMMKFLGNPLFMVEEWDLEGEVK